MRPKLCLSFALTLCLTVVSFTALAEESDPGSRWIDINAKAENDLLSISGSLVTGTSGSSPIPYTWSADSVEHVLVGGGRVRVFMSVREKEECLNTIGGDPQGICSLGATAEEDDAAFDDVPGADPYVLALEAVNQASVRGAGLVVTPNRDWVYMNIPTLAHAQHPVVDTSVELFGMNVPVRFEAQEFLFDFHSGEQPIRTTSPGAPYPDMSIQSTYVEQYDSQHVTLTTTWSAYVTHPITGDQIHVPGALRTEEDSAPFRVIRSRHRLITPEEFGRE